MTNEIELTRWVLYRNDSDEGEEVRVPHDAMLGETRSADAPTGNAGAYFNGGVYRYERMISLPAHGAAERVTLEFGGVMGRTSVLVDGQELASHVYGYTPFSVDLTGVLKPGQRALLTVVADNSAQPNSRWYAGSGIYRPVRLVAQGADRIERGGVTITTASLAPACVRVQSAVVGDAACQVTIERAGTVLARGEGTDLTLEVPDALPWSAEEPNLYDCVVRLRNAGGLLVDEARVPFGIRTLAWGEEGLLVNGEPVKLRGGCVHHTHGILGAADLPEASRRDVALLKSWGFNAIRSAHNPISESMLAACDELGMYVMDEYADMWYQRKNPCDYANDFEACREEDLAAMVVKDRNHPCVIMYSIGNENVEPYEERGQQVARELVAAVKALDPTRPVTAGVNPAILFAASRGIDSFNADGDEGAAAGNASSVDDAQNMSLLYNTYVSKMGDVMELMAGSIPVGKTVAPYLDALDIAGYNYATRRYRPDLRTRPERPVFGSETMPYDLARNWKLVESDARIIGDFMWTSLDYLGECSLAAWSDDPTPVNKPFPWLCADTGALDLIGDPNGEAAMAKAVWCAPEEPLVFVRPADLPKPVKAPWRGTNSVPCWSWRGSEGNRTVVEVYTQAPVAKLYLNGRHVGTKRVRDCHADFSVSYEAGELIALACSSDGRALGRTTLASADGTLGLRLSLERHDGNIAFVRVDAADAAGVVEGSRFDEVTVSVTGGELIAFGSAAQKSELSYLGGTFPLRYGRGLAVVRVGAGCTVSAWAEGLGAATLKL